MKEEQIPELENAPSAGALSHAETVAQAEQPAASAPLTMKQKISAFIKESSLVMLQVLVIFLIVINFVGRVSIVQGSSMNPSLETNNRVLINLLSYRFTTPHRGDVIVFQCPTSTGKDYIKRIVGLPGETVEIKNGTVFVNGKKLDEPYLQYVDKYENVSRRKVPEGQVYVLGDNRINSEDSRVWGPVDCKLIKGKADIVFWPIRSISILK